MRRVPPVEQERVAVGVAERRHVAHARVEDVAVERHALFLERPLRLRDVRHAQRDRRRVRPAELLPDVRRVEEVQERVLAELELGPPTVTRLLEAERVPVPRRRPLEIRHGHRHEVGPLDGDHPTDPSIWSWIRRFISTAYSSGSSFVIGSTNPETTIAEASDSESPRDMR